MKKQTVIEFLRNAIENKKVLLSSFPKTNPTHHYVSGIIDAHNLCNILVNSSINYQDLIGELLVLIKSDYEMYITAHSSSSLKYYYEGCIDGHMFELGLIRNSVSLDYIIK